MTVCIKVGVIFAFSLYIRIVHVFVLTHPLYCEEVLMFLAEERPFGLDGLKRKKDRIFLSDRITFLSKPQLLVFFGGHQLQRIYISFFLSVFENSLKTTDRKIKEDRLALMALLVLR